MRGGLGRPKAFLRGEIGGEDTAFPVKEMEAVCARDPARDAQRCGGSASGCFSRQPGATSAHALLEDFLTRRGSCPPVEEATPLEALQAPQQRGHWPWAGALLSLLPG